MSETREEISLATIRRRDVLKGGSAALFGLASMASGTESAPRVVIVGAGVAGLAAARVFVRRRVPFVLLEARDRIGGRAYTDWKSLGMPFDQGCGYLGAPQVNPVAALAPELGFSVAHEILQPEIWLGTEAQGVKGTKAFDAAYAELSRAIATAGAHGDDVSAASLVAGRTILDRVAAFTIGSAQTGVALNQLSTLDWYSQLYNTAPREGRIKQGIGNLVAAFGNGIPISLSTPVTRIDCRGPRVKVETNAGTVETEFCLVTVPLGVLRAGAIAFLPPLPPPKQTAIANIGVGVVNKIALAFKPGTLPPERTAWHYQVRKDGTIADVTVRPFGADMSVHVTGGDVAREIELLNNADQITLALSTITDIYGSDVAAGFANAAVTRWWRDSFAQGSHSATLPGEAHARAELARPVAERLHFAGEACATTWASALPGALETGRSAARAIADKLGAISLKPAGEPALHEKD